MTASPSIEICQVVMQGTWSETGALAQCAETQGHAAFGICDSPMMCRDMHLGCAASVLATEQLRIITAVTNPVTRHPSIMASGFAQLHEMAPGRVVCGIATGDSAVWGVGLRPSKVAELREYILAMKALTRGETAHFEGAEFSQRWEKYQPFELPVLVACSGPRMIRMASQVADGLILAVGVSPEDLQWANTLIEEACAEVGRDPGTLEIWQYAEVTCTANRELAAENSLGLFTHWMTMGSTHGKRIPEEFIEPLHKLNEGSQNLDTSYGDKDRGSKLVARAKELGLYDWIISRAPCLWGTPLDIAERMMTLRDRGISRWMVYPEGADLSSFEVAEALGETRRLIFHQSGS